MNEDTQEALTGDEQNAGDGSVNAEASEAAVTPATADQATETVEDTRDAQIADLTAKLEEAETNVAVLTAERDALQKQLEARAKAPRSRSGDVSAKARKVGPVDAQEPAEDLIKAIAAAEKVEIAFSDGKKELAIAPLQVAGECWAMTLVGLQLRLPELLVRGLADRAVTLAGYGLFLDDRQVAFAPRDPFKILPGQQVNLRDDVVFA